MSHNFPHSSSLRLACYKSGRQLIANSKCRPTHVSEAASPGKIAPGIVPVILFWPKWKCLSMYNAMTSMSSDYFVRRSSCINTDGRSRELIQLTEIRRDRSSKLIAVYRDMPASAHWRVQSAHSSQSPLRLGTTRTPSRSELSITDQN